MSALLEYLTNVSLKWQSRDLQCNPVKYCIGKSTKSTFSCSLQINNSNNSIDIKQNVFYNKVLKVFVVVRLSHLVSGDLADDDFTSAINNHISWVRIITSAGKAER